MYRACFDVKIICHKTLKKKNTFWIFPENLISRNENCCFVSTVFCLGYMATNTFIGPSSNQAVVFFFSVFDQTFQNYRSILTGSDAAGLQLYSAANVQRYADYQQHQQEIAQRTFETNNRGNYNDGKRFEPRFFGCNTYLASVLLSSLNLLNRRQRPSLLQQCTTVSNRTCSLIPILIRADAREMRAFHHVVDWSRWWKWFDQFIQQRRKVW
jgi:hypothetical protein